MVMCGLIRNFVVAKKAPCAWRCRYDIDNQWGNGIFWVLSNIELIIIYSHKIKQNHTATLRCLLFSN